MIYYIGIQHTGQVRLCNFDPAIDGECYKFGFGPYFSVNEVIEWLKWWKSIILIATE